MRIVGRVGRTAGVALLMVVSCGSAGATAWEEEISDSSWTMHYCWENNIPACPITYTTVWRTLRGQFANQESALQTCNSTAGAECGIVSVADQPLHAYAGNVWSCLARHPSGVCTTEQFISVFAYFPTVVIEQDVERPTDCRSTSRQFGNPIDGLTGEKRESIGLLRWSPNVPALHLHYRSGRFARQVGDQGLAGNNIPGYPGAAGTVGAGIPDSGGSQPFGALWTHDLDGRLSVSVSTGHGRVSRLPGGGALNFRGVNRGPDWLPASDQADRLQYWGALTGGEWLHRDPRLKRTHFFSASGMLIHVVNADGTGRQWLSYSDSTTPRTQAAGPDRLLSIRDAQGRQLRVVYLRAANGLATDLIGDLTDDQGSRTSFEYDSASRLTAVRWPDGSLQRFSYDATLPWALTARIDEAGVAVGNWTWDHSSGLVTSTTGADGVGRHVLRFGQAPRIHVTEALEGRTLRRRYTWQAGSDSEVIQPNGTSVTLGPTTVNGHLQLTQRSQPAGAGCNASVQTSVLDANGNAVVRDNFDGSRSCHAYDLARNLELVRVEGLDRSANCAAVLAEGAALPTGARKITTRWHPVWPLEQQVAYPGRIAHHIYNAQPDPFGNNIALTCMPDVGYDEGFPDIPPAALCRRVQRATTDANGGQGLQAAIDPAVPARDERWTYNRQGRMLGHDGPRADVADITTYAYHPATTANATAGDLLSVTDAAGHVTWFTRYNRNGQLLERQDANGAPTSFAYDQRQRLVQVTQAGRRTQFDYALNGTLTRVTLPDAGTLVYGYDNAQRLTSISDSSGNRIRYTLDNEGHRIREERQDAQGMLTRRLTRVFDALGRVQEQVGRP